MAKIRTLIVDDHQIVREGLRTYLELMEDIDLVSEAENGAQAIEQVRQHQPDVVLMDLVMPGLGGIEATRQINTIHPATKVIVLTSFTDDEMIFAAIQAGAAGYLLKDISPLELGQAIQAVHEGEKHLHPDITRKLMNQFVNLKAESDPKPGQLTPREQEVLTFIAQGLSNRELAQTLTISEKTVKSHVSHILSKLHLSDRTQAAIYAYKHGLVPD